MIATGVSQAVAMRVSGQKTPSVFRCYQIVETEDVGRALDTVAAHGEKPTGALVKLR